MADDKAPVSEKPTDETNVEATTEVAKTAPRRKKAKRSVPSGQMHILATFNNTLITFTDSKGGALVTATSGGQGFRGSKKGTAYAAQVAAEKAIAAVKQQHGMSKVDVFVRGIGLGRDAAIRSLIGAGINVERIVDVTPVAHGGVRPRKARRA